MSTQDIRERTTLPSNGVGQQSWVSRPITINDWAIFHGGAGQVIPQFSEQAITTWTLNTDGGLGRSIVRNSDHLTPRDWVAPGAYLAIASIWFNASAGTITGLRMKSGATDVAWNEGDGTTTGRCPVSCSALIPWSPGSPTWLQLLVIHNLPAGLTVTNCRVSLIKIA